MASKKFCGNGTISVKEVEPVEPSVEEAELAVQEQIFQYIQLHKDGVQLGNLAGWAFVNGVTNIKSPLDKLIRNKRVFRCSGGFYKASNC